MAEIEGAVTRIETGLTTTRAHIATELGPVLNPVEVIEMVEFINRTTEEDKNDERN